VVVLAPLIPSEVSSARRVRDETRRDLGRVMTAVRPDLRVVAELQRFIDVLDGALADYARAGRLRRLRRRPTPAGAVRLEHFLHRWSDRFLVMWAVVGAETAA
jgi:hypothetical protein